MLRYVLIFITALMFITDQNNNVHSAILQHLVPFKNNFFREVADFDSIVEPQTNQDSENNVINRRHSMESESTEYIDEDYFNKIKASKTAKRDLTEVEKYRNKIFDIQDSADRPERAFNELESEYLEEDDDDSIEGGKGNNGTDAATQEEVSNAENVTKGVQREYDQIETPQLGTVNDEGEPCDADENKSEGEKREGGKNGMEAKNFIGQTARKNRLRSSDDFLKTHYFKYLSRNKGGGVQNHYDVNRPERQFNELVSDYSEQDEDEQNKGTNNATDPETEEELRHAENVTTTIKAEFEQIESPQSTVNASESEGKPEREEKYVGKNEVLTKNYIKKTSKKNHLKLTDDLMKKHYYKHSPKEGATLQNQDSTERAEREFTEIEEPIFEEESEQDRELGGTNTSGLEMKEETVRNLTEAVGNNKDQTENLQMVVELNNDEKKGKGDIGEIDKGGSEKTYVEDTVKKINLGSSNDFVETHVFKYISEKDASKVKPESNEPFTVNLYSAPSTEEPVVRVSKAYLGLLSDNKNFIKVPAIKFIVANRGDKMDETIEKPSNYEPFLISRHKNNALRSYKFKPVQNIFKVVDGEKINYENLKYRPIFFLNTIPRLHEKLKKRAFNFEITDNKYLRDVDMLIQDIDTSLRLSDLGESQKTMRVNGEVLTNSKYQNSFFNQRDELKATPYTNVDFSRSEINPLEQNLIKTEINPLDTNSHQDSLLNIHNNVNLSPVKNELSPSRVLFSDKKGGALDMSKVKEDSILSNSFNEMESVPFKGNVHKSEINAMQLKSDNVHLRPHPKVDSAFQKKSNVAINEVNSLIVPSVKERGTNVDNAMLSLGNE